MIEEKSFGKVRALHMGRDLFGFFPPFMKVYTYAIDGLLVDTGLESFSRQVSEFCQKQKVHSSFITHHHEDHCGNASNLKKEGVELMGPPKTAELANQNFRIHFYQKIVWGQRSKGKLDLSLPKDKLITTNYQFEVIQAPGHCPDQYVLYEPYEGWIFSGDAYLNSRVKYFRKDEDFYLTLKTLEKLSSLPCESIFCAHYPVLTNGQQMFKEKLNYMVEIKERVLALYQKGWKADEITRDILGKTPLALKLFTLGDLSKKNLTLSILNGPTPRKGMASFFD